MKSNSLFKIKENWPQLMSAVLIVVVLLVVFYYGRRANAFYEQIPVKLNIYSFSTQEEVFSESILPAFEKVWEAETGQELEFEIVFGPSAALAGEINLGAPADIVIFSNAYHVNWLKLGRKVDMDTKPVVIGQTPMVIITRPGNPRGILGFADLAKTDFCLLHADPQSSGAGEWAILAEYGSALKETGSPEEGKHQLGAIWENVKFLGASARATLAVFEMGVGDALITYEQDALYAQQRGLPLQIIYPSRTIIAQHVAVQVDENIILRERPVVQAFMDYLISDPVQQVFASYHLRPVRADSDDFPPIESPFTVDELGGWPSAYSDLVESYWQKEIKPRLDLTPTSLLVDAED